MQTKTTKFHPILFSTPMVQAIIKGDKTQTRRTKGLELLNCSSCQFRYDGFNEEEATHYMEFLEENGNPTEKYKELGCPYEVGDVLWVRENFYTGSNFDHWKPSQLEQCNVEVFFQADLKNHDIPRPLSRGKIRPSIFLPFKYCRTFLKVKSIRVERLQEISEEDAKAEGAHFLYHGLGTVIIDSHPYWEKLYKSRASYKHGFHYIWKYINGEDSWQFNPFVFVYEFEKIEKPLDFI